MKAALSFALIASLVLTPLAGCAARSGPRHVDEVPSNQPPERNWSRVGEVAPATELLVTVKGARPITRWFVMTDPSTITVLNLDNRALPPNAARVLLRIASRRPDLLASIQKGDSLREDNVLVGREGVFVANRKVADLAEVVEKIPRGDVTEVSGPVVARGSVVGTVLGGFLGFCIGVVPGLGGASAGAAWSFMVASITAGGYLGFRSTSHETEGLIYSVR